MYLTLRDGNVLGAPVNQPAYSSGLPEPRGRSPRPAARSRRGRRLTRVLWTLVPLCSVGILACVPFFALAVATKKFKDWCVTAGYFVGTVLMFVVLAQGSPTTAPDQTASSADSIGGGLILLLMGVGSVHTWLVYRQPAAEPAPWPPAAPAMDANARAVARARAAVQRRAEARQIALTDPILARDLRIGRPDLPREYDDGGLVDVNHVSAEVLAESLGWTLADAEAVTAARAQTNGFSSVAELTAYVALDPYRVDAVADLLVFYRA